MAGSRRSALACRACALAQRAWCVTRAELYRDATSPLRPRFELNPPWAPEIEPESCRRSVGPFRDTSATPLGSGKRVFRNRSIARAARAAAGMPLQRVLRPCPSGLRLARNHVEREAVLALVGDQNAQVVVPVHQWLHRPIRSPAGALKLGSNIEGGVPHQPLAGMLPAPAPRPTSAIRPAVVSASKRARR